MKIVASRFPSSRPRRLRRSKNIRSLVQETSFSVSDLIWPVFICEGTNKRVEVKSM
ncbi:MAG: porphobilinogen synthase, partial [Rhodobacteraceae bacterium]|nr:porphobilinogen synthase [Paracoccaceae bacterium]